MSNERLKAMVKAVNRANAAATALYETLEKAFTPLVGKPVTKQDGSLLAKVEKTLPAMPDGGNVMVYRMSSSYSLAWVVKTWEEVKGAGHVVYHETPVYVGSLRGATLTEISKPIVHRDDYTAEEVEGKRMKYREAEEAMRQARSELYPFGDCDR